MAAPPVTARIVPVGAKMGNGFQTLVALQNVPTLLIWERSVKPPGMSIGDKIDTSTMLNASYKTFEAPALKEVTDGTAEVLFDPEVWSDIEDQIGQNQAITWHYPTGFTWTEWGYIQEMEPGDFTDGDAPTATLTYVATNWDPVNCVEAGPVFGTNTGSC